MYQAEILATCVEKMGQEASCNKITNGPIDVTSKMPVPTSAPTPAGQWVDTAWGYVPYDVKKAATDKVRRKKSRFLMLTWFHRVLDSLLSARRTKFDFEKHS